MATQILSTTAWLRPEFTHHKMYRVRTCSQDGRPWPVSSVGGGWGRGAGIKGVCLELLPAPAGAGSPTWFAEGDLDDDEGDEGMQLEPLSISAGAASLP